MRSTADDDTFVSIVNPGTTLKFKVGYHVWANSTADIYPISSGFHSEW
jgi:hypothetical protein